MATLTALNFYPIKSCAGIALREATLTPAGLMSEHIYDREWMVIDEQGQFLTQREHPCMARITPRIRNEMLELSAPGMLRLELPLDLADPDQAPTRDVMIWEERVKAYDCDDLTATWFSKAIGVPCRLVRFHPHASRHANPRWAGALAAPTLFADGYPLLLISQGSLDDLNTKLIAAGRPALPMNRFRPNIVIDGIPAFEEDFAEHIDFGKARIKPVKPCPRCPIPSVDQATGELGPDPLDILQTYRSNALIDGGISFGMNAVLLDGEGVVVRLGQAVEVNLAL
jgi:uncharacterized protein YcbX